MKSVFVLLCVIVAVAVARSPIPQEYCPQLDCPNLNCPSPSYQGMDASGCRTCTCCPGVMCMMYCPYGNRIGDDGCPKCECRVGLMEMGTDYHGTIMDQLVERIQDHVLVTL